MATAEELERRWQEQQALRQQAVQGGAMAQQGVAMANTPPPPQGATQQSLEAQWQAQRQAATQAATPMQPPQQQPQQGVPESLPSGGYSAGVAQGLLSLGSSVVAEPLAGLAGSGVAFYNALLGDDAARKGAETVQEVRDALTYTPDTKEGMAVLGAIGDIFSPVGEVLDTSSEGLGDTLYDLSGGNEIAGTIGYTIPAALLEAGPLALAKKAARASRIANASQEVRTVTEALQNPETLVGSATGGKWKLDADGVAVENKMGKQLTKEIGVSEADAALITNSNKATKKVMDEITSSFNKYAKGDIDALKPSQIIGREAGRMMGQINDYRKQVGQQLGDLVEGKLGDTPIDATPALTAFNVELQKLGGVAKVSPNGKRYLDFSNAPSADIKALSGFQNVLQDAFQITGRQMPSTLLEVHNLKRGLDELLDAKKLEQGGKLGQAERLVLDLRTQLNGLMDGVDGYRQVNQQYGRLRDSLAAFDQYRPQGMTWDDPKVNNSIGDAVNKASGDTASANNIIHDLKIGNEIMREIGAKPFDIDVYGLARYNMVLNEQFFNAVRNNIPKGSWIRQGGKNIQGAALSAIVGNKFGVANNVGGLIQNGIEARIAYKSAADAVKNQKLIRQALRQ